LRPHDALQRAHRVRAQDPQFQTVYRQHRPMVERSIAWLVAGGNRRLRFLGTRRNDLWLHHRAAALNLRRLLTLGLTRSGGSWALSLAPTSSVAPPKDVPAARSSAASSATSAAGSSGP